MAIPTSDSDVRLLFLGRFEVRDGERALIDRAWPRRRAAALLKLLAIQRGRAMHREQVQEALWPALDAASAANNLHKNLHYLRAELAPVHPSAVTLVGGTLRVDPAIPLDVDDFVAASREARGTRAVPAYEHALAVYAGDLLPDDLYEAWSQSQRDQLRATRQQLLIEVSRLYVSAGEYGLAESRLVELLEDDPIHEDTHRRLMRLYAEAGNRDKALRQYRRCRDALERDLGVRPSSETEVLLREITASAAPSPPPQPSEPLAPADTAGSVAEPAVQYTTCPDGVNLAFWTFGEGPPLVVMPNIPMSHIQAEWRMPEWRSFYRRLAGARAVIRYDARGTGLSDRQECCRTLESQVTDLETIADCLALKTFDLFAGFSAGPAAIAFAAQNPGRVSRLVLWSTYATGASYLSMPQVHAMTSLADKDWWLYCQTLAHTLVGWEHHETAGRLAEVLRDSTSQKLCVEFNQGLAEVDVTPLLRQVRTPTLILHRRGVPYIGAEAVRPLARGINGALFMLLDGAEPHPIVGDVDGAVSAIDNFLTGASGGRGRR